MSRARRALIGAAALACVAGLAVFLWPRADADGASTAPVDRVSPPPPPPPVAAGKAAGAPAPEEMPESVQRYLEATVYPPSSGRLTAGDHDLLHPNTRYERPRPIGRSIGGDPSAVLRYLLTADHYHLEAGATARATFQAWRGSTPVPGEIRIEQAAMVAEGCAGEVSGEVPVAFSWRGEGLEADLSFRRFDDHHGSVRLSVDFTLGDDPEVERAELRFFHTPASRVPALLLPDRFRDELRDGSLHLELAADVRDPGFYRFDANLYGGGDRPVAFASFKGELAAGVQPVPMVVYGKVLRDAGVPGPYRVSQLRGYRFLDGRCPDRENLPMGQASFITAAHPLSAFTDAPHMSEHKRRMVDLMLADEEAGIGPEFPDPATEGGAPGPRPPDDDFEAPPPPGPEGPRGG